MSVNSGWISRLCEKLVNVASVSLRVGALLGRAAPGLFARLAPRLGASEVTEAMADALRHQR